MNATQKPKTPARTNTYLLRKTGTQTYYKSGIGWVDVDKAEVFDAREARVFLGHLRMADISCHAIDMADINFSSLKSAQGHTTECFSGNQCLCEG